MNPKPRDRELACSQNPRKPPNTAFFDTNSTIGMSEKFERAYGRLNDEFSKFD
jgi:hypothetical protein